MARKARNRRRGRVLLLVLTALALRAVGLWVASHPATSAVAGSLLACTVLSGLLVRWKLRRRTRHKQLMQAAEASRYRTMDPAEFENALALLCVRDGCRDVDVTGRSGDLGADVIGYSPDGAKVVLQAKRYATTNKVTGPDLQRFGGTCFTVHRADIAAVVTTSTFTKAARDYALLAGIRLVDATALTAWATRTGPPPWHRTTRARCRTSERPRFTPRNVGRRARHLPPATAAGDHHAA
jgi:restriction system protein